MFIGLANGVLSSLPNFAARPASSTLYSPLSPMFARLPVRDGSTRVSRGILFREVPRKASFSGVFCTIQKRTIVHLFASFANNALAHAYVSYNRLRTSWKYSNFSMSSAWNRSAQIRPANVKYLYGKIPIQSSTGNTDPFAKCAYHQTFQE